MLGHRSADRPHRYGQNPPPIGFALALMPILLAVALLGAGCSFSGKKNAASPAPTAAAATPTALALSTSSTPSPATAAPTPAPVRPFTPPPAPPRATPAPTPVSNVRTENGLQIQDEQFLGRVATPGGVRIRSAPDATAANVVGSIPEGVLVTVEGKVLNGAEAEPGKGTVWYIVGPKQYIYGAEGYVLRVSGTPAR
jgi:hypothetical protein